jgi:hypothetical protein
MGTGVSLPEISPISFISRTQVPRGTGGSAVGALRLRHRPDYIRGELHNGDYSKDLMRTNQRLSRRLSPGGEIQIEEYGQASRTISTTLLKPSRALHVWPIKEVVFLRPSGALRPRESLS